MNNEKFKDLKNEIGYEKIKENFSNKIIERIRNEKIDIEEVALALGISKESVLNMLVNPYTCRGSELALINDNIEKRLKK